MKEVVMDVTIKVRMTIVQAGDLDLEQNQNSRAHLREALSNAVEAAGWQHPLTTEVYIASTESEPW